MALRKLVERLSSEEETFLLALATNAFVEASKGLIAFNSREERGNKRSWMEVEIGLEELVVAMREKNHPLREKIQPLREESQGSNQPIGEENSGLTMATMTMETALKLQHAIQEYKASVWDSGQKSDNVFYFQADVQVYENLSEEAKDRLYLETLKRTVNISGGKKDPETLRREALCEALDSLVEKDGNQQISKMSVAKTDSPKQHGGGFLADEKSNVRVTGSRGVRGKGVNMSSSGVEKGKKRGNGSLLQGGKAEREATSGTEKDDSKPVSRGRGLSRRGRGGGLAKQNWN